jgi:hypothetical protein
MSKLTEAEKERLYDLERSGAIYTKPACPACSCELAPNARFCDNCGCPIAPAQPSAQLASLIDWIDQQITVKRGEVEDGCTYTEYSIGDVVIWTQHNGYVPTGGTPNMLEIGGQSIDMPWTLPMLQQVHTDLGRLLSDARVVAALESECEDSDDRLTLAREADRLLEQDDQIVRSRDAAHREERLIAILEKIADMDEPAQSEAFGYACGLLAGMAAKHGTGK